MFVELDESVGDGIIFGDATKISVKGKGKIFINLKNGKHGFISNVYWYEEHFEFGTTLSERL